MKSLITTLLTIGIIVPGATYAFSMDDIIEAAKAGNGTYVETHSSVSTGGQTATGGENVQTGDANASSYTEINAGPDGGEVKIKIETGANGETKTQEFTQPIEKGEGIKVEANASIKDGDSESEVKVNDEEVASNSNNSQTASASVAISSKISLLITQKIPLFFKKIFSFFS